MTALPETGGDGRARASAFGDCRWPPSRRRPWSSSNPAAAACWSATKPTRSRSCVRWRPTRLLRARAGRRHAGRRPGSTARSSFAVADRWCVARSAISKSRCSGPAEPEPRCAATPAVDRFDLVVDLQATPLLRQAMLPLGYYAPGADETARHGVARSAAADARPVREAEVLQLQPRDLRARSQRQARLHSDASWPYPGRGDRFDPVKP